MDSGEPSESVTNGQTRQLNNFLFNFFIDFFIPPRNVQPPPSAALKAKQQRPKKGFNIIN